MKDEPRNRSVWERMKMAFRLLFSVKALEPVYKEGWEDGRRGLYDDYKVMKETIEPFVKKVHDTAWHGDSAITIPGMIPTELFQIAYYDKFKMYASETCDEYEAQRSKKKDNDLTMEDILAINMMAAACKNKSFYKQIGEANDDEDDD